MARQILPIAGAVVGAYFGNPQLGFAIGSLIGNAVDPIEMQGRKLGDAPSQTASEGGARAIVFGKGCIRATVIIERGGRKVVKERDKSGSKGGGPVTVNERALWTYAIGLGEAIPGGAILRIWENEKLVYDVTPASQIVKDSTEFAKLFRFYDGSEGQLPDPAIEAIYTDPTDAPYYRGTAYMVFPQRDLTDFGEAVPTYRVEVATESELIVGDVHEGPYVPVSVQNLVGPVVWMSGDKPLVVTSYSSGTFNNFVAVGQSYRVTEYDLDFVEEGHTDITNMGLSAYPVDQRIGVLAINDAGGALCVGGNFPGVARFSNGVYAADLRPTGATAQNWYAGAIEQQMAFDQTGYAWIGDDFIYLGVTRTGVSLPTVHNKIYRWGAAASGIAGASATLEVEPVSVAVGVVFMMAVSRQGSVYVYRYSTGAITEYDQDFENPADLPIPAVVQAWPAGQLVGFGVDEALGIACFVRRIAAGVSQSVVVADLAGEVIDTVVLDSEVNNSSVCRVVFSNLGAVIQIGQRFYRLEISNDSALVSVKLRVIVAALHQRAGHSVADYDTTELTDDVVGVTIEQTVTAAEAINSIIGGYFADAADYDGKIRYIKRGKPVIRTLTIDDLIDEPETWQRNNAIEYPAKVHFFGQIAELAYASVKATSARCSADVKVVGEVSIASPETFNDSTRPYEIAAIYHKVLWTEAGGEVTWRVTDEHIDLVPTDCVGLAWAGQLWRARITQIETDPGELKLKMSLDRQSAYTANLTAIPVPPAVTPPQTGIVSDTVLAVMDIPALVDSADDLHIVTAMSGETDTWAGAALQRSLDAGATFGTVGSSTLNAIMGTLQDAVTAASPHYTDTTNAIVVKLYTDDDIDSLTDQAFLSEGGAFALAWNDGGTQRWELMQYRDAEQVAAKTYRLTTLARGRLDTAAAAHPVGAMFVLLDAAIQRQAAQSAWIGTDLTHRAVSIGQTPDGADEQTMTYAGNSQREWAPAHVFMERTSSDAVTARVVPRHRFGTDDVPVRSTHWIGYRWIVTDGSNTITRDWLSETEVFSTIGWAPDVDVSVAQVNAITGVGPYISTSATQPIPPSVGGSVIVAQTSNSGMQGGPTLGSTDFVPHPAPMGIESGDALLAYVYAGSAITAPAGWTLIESVTASTATVAVYRKDTVTTANSGEVFPWSVTDGFSLRLLRYALIRSSTGVVSIAASNSAVTSKVGATYPHTVSMAPATAVNNSSVAIAFAGTPSMTPVWWGTGPMVLSGEGPTRGTGENCAFGIERVNANQTSDASIIARAIVIPPPPPVSGTAYYGAVNVILEAG